MASHQITSRFKISGVLTATTASVLSDPTGTFGIKRAGDGEPVVAAGTAMAMDSTGVYSYLYTAAGSGVVIDPVAGTAYVAFVKHSFGGADYYGEVEFTVASTTAADSYIPTITEAKTLGATLTALPGVTALMATGDAELGALLLAASLDIDTAMPYQGCKYDPSQEREFPRYVNPLGNQQRMIDYQQSAIGNWIPGVWDWDSDTSAAIVPATVKMACLLQAASIKTDPNFRGRLDAIRSGLAAQSIGSLSETYLAPASLPGGMTGLCDRAQKLMDRYRLRSGGLL